MKDFKPFFQINKSLWDEKTPVHLVSEMYDAEAFKNGKTSLDDIFLGVLDNVEKLNLLHLQCHFGQDTISLAKMGAHATGLDLSSASIAAAKELNQTMGTKAKFVESNVYNALDVLKEESFDYIVSSYGAIPWLPDLNEWARIIHKLLKPNGTFLLVEFHPMINMIDWETGIFSYPYFNNENKNPITEEVEGTYADKTSDIKSKECFWLHSLGEIFSAFLNNGFKIELFKEYAHSPYDCFENMTKKGDRNYVYSLIDPPFPHVFALKTRKK